MSFAKISLTHDAADDDPNGLMSPIQNIAHPDSYTNTHVPYYHVYMHPYADLTSSSRTARFPDKREDRMYPSACQRHVPLSCFYQDHRSHGIG